MKEFPLERFRDDFSCLFRLEVIMRVPVLYEALNYHPSEGGSRRVAA